MAKNSYMYDSYIYDSRTLKQIKNISSAQSQEKLAFSPSGNVHYIVVY
jgi:hypothetical protein